MAMLSHHFLLKLQVEMGAEAPALTVSQVRRLLHVLLPKRLFDEAGVNAEIEPIQRHNSAAYFSHRKQHLQALKRLQPK